MPSNSFNPYIFHSFHFPFLPFSPSSLTTYQVLLLISQSGNFSKIRLCSDADLGVLKSQKDSSGNTISPRTLSWTPGTRREKEQSEASVDNGRRKCDNVCQNVTLPPSETIAK
ncbi:hypothetical protein TNCT_208001 [Trichonephila clavata]|uniref:Uncharacterized protein n=1 Tax=Trichonephila clavata TaxID=2740835 RepID=A0A8X6H5R0_TRICU|nr:hypothetical protein TNCT_208001 [Trichonephila clavata]